MEREWDFLQNSDDEKDDFDLKVKSHKKPPEKQKSFIHRSFVTLSFI